MFENIRCARGLSPPPLGPNLPFTLNKLTQLEEKMSRRPIPYKKTETLFWTYVGTAPEWFVCDEEVVDAKLFSSIENAEEWIRRREEDGLSLPRVLACTNEGNMYWLTHGVRVALNAFGNPDFSTGEPAYEE